MKTTIIIVILVLLWCMGLHYIKDSISRFIIKVFLMYWGFGLIFSSFQPFNFYEIDISTYLIVLFGMSGFILGMIFTGLLKTKNKYLSSIPVNIRFITKLLNNKIFIVLVTLISLYQFQFAQNALFLAAIDNESTSLNKFEGVFMGNTFAIWLWMYGMFPIYYVLNVLISTAIIRKIKISLIGIIAYLLFYVIFSILTGGRSIFSNFFFSFIISFICINPHFSIRSITPKMLALGTALCTILFIGMLYMSAFRGHGEFSIKEESFDESIQDMTERPLRYLALPYVLLDISFKENYLDKFGGYQMGRVTFGGGDILLAGLINRCGGSYESSEYITIYLQDQWKSCAPDHAYNYAYTGILSHYLDFGLIGVWIFPFLFGFIFRLIIISFMKNRSIWGFITINFFFFLMLQAAFSNFLHNLPTFLFAIFLLFGNMTNSIIKKIKIIM